MPPPGYIMFLACPTGRKHWCSPRTRWSDYYFTWAWKYAKEREVWGSLISRREWMEIKTLILSFHVPYHNKIINIPPMLPFGIETVVRDINRALLLNYDDNYDDDCSQLFGPLQTPPIPSETLQLVKKNPKTSVLCNRNIIEPPMMFNGINLVFSKCTLNCNRIYTLQTVPVETLYRCRWLLQRVPIYSISMMYLKDFGMN